MRKTTFDFEDAFWLKLESYCRASDAVKSKVVRRALDELINRELLRNPGMNERYEQQRAQLLASAGNNVALIGSRRKPRKKTSLSVEPGVEAKTQK